MSERTVLVIDDEKELGKTIEMMLEVVGGYRVIAAFDGKEGIKKAHMTKPDLIILDIMMPELNGLETLRILKEDAGTMKIPVIMLTACDEDIYRLKAAQLYDEDYLTKPVKAQELVSRVEKVFARRKVK